MSFLWQNLSSTTSTWKSFESLATMKAPDGGTKASAAGTTATEGWIGDEPCEESTTESVAMEDSTGDETTHVRVTQTEPQPLEVPMLTRET